MFEEKFSLQGRLSEGNLVRKGKGWIQEKHFNGFREINCGAENGPLLFQLDAVECREGKLVWPKKKGDFQFWYR